MSKFLISLALLTSLSTYGDTKSECLSGNFSSCRIVINQYGSSSNRVGAVSFFEKACSAQTLLVSCRIISIRKSESMKRSLELAKPDTGMFIMVGKEIDKFYEISKIK